MSTFHFQISGCKEIKVLADEVGLNGDSYYVYKLSLTATVTEDGTGEEFKGETTASVKRTALEFSYIGKEKYSKPNLPFTGKVWLLIDYVFSFLCRIFVIILMSFINYFPDC